MYLLFQFNLLQIKNMYKLTDNYKICKNKLLGVSMNSKIQSLIFSVMIITVESSEHTQKLGSSAITYLLIIPLLEVRKR